MKKIMRFVTVLGAASFILGFIISIFEKRKEKVGRKKEERHHFYGPYETYFKRPLDFTLAFMALIFLAPVLVVIAVLVKVKLGAPVIFSQERPGKDGRIFKLYKFRTMTEEKGADGKFLSDEERLTEFGKKLRSSSLDELPELFNILTGDMSLVGPRPLLAAYLPRYNQRQAHRHDVRPGLTGLAQVSGRNSLSWEEKFEDDITYVEKITFMGDLKILIRTILIVFKGTGISSHTSATMEEFQGSM
ncbi:undecaprenyl phosphate N,N'-diacetylbacillosamine 1-phosphate transferase [Lachnospiraceae bacterium]|nr:undecaprenyl phosphate N,N'-diacetylbacillosamine 1-phosphate transferase [Lachnospiraceae bacterium]